MSCGLFRLAAMLAGLGVTSTLDYVDISGGEEILTFLAIVQSKQHQN
jgi:hypothetical protein